jgi:hypothetical protein
MFASETPKKLKLPYCEGAIGGDARMIDRSSECRLSEEFAPFEPHN